MPARSSFTAIGIVLGMTLSVCADESDIKKAAKAMAEECQVAMVKGEFDKAADLTHPLLVEKLGGKKRMVERLTTEMKKMKEKGVELKSATSLEPSDPVRVGKEIYIGIPFTMEMSVPGGRLRSRSFLIGVSMDNGKTWVFVDANPLANHRDKLLQILPKLPEAIVIPKPGPPAFIKD